MDTSGGQIKRPDLNVEKMLKSPQEIALLQQIRDSNDAIKHLEAEYLSLFRQGKIDACVKKHRGIEFAKKYINGLCAKHKKLYRRR